jgi:hypothetical protein
MWGKVKESWRDAKARTQEDLYEAIARGLKTVTPHDATARLRSCGYNASQV